MRKLLLLFSLLLLNAGILLAQNKPQNKPLKGTYQIEMWNSREKPLIPNNIAEIVEKNRKENEVSYYNIADNIRVMILPRSVISKPNFVPLELEVIHKFN